jgi:hypothetical protein
MALLKLGFYERANLGASSTFGKRIMWSICGRIMATGVLLDSMEEGMELL